MAAKKLIIVIASIAVGLALLVALSVGGIVALTRYSMGNSEAAIAAQTFLRNNEKLKQDIGEVKDFGAMVTSSINTHNAPGEATLTLKVIGARKTVKATVDLVYLKGKSWRVSGASYRNEAGNTIELFDPYEAKIESRSASGDAGITEGLLVNQKKQIPDLKFEISNLRSEISNLKSQISNPKSEISSLRLPFVVCRSRSANSAIAEHCPESVVLV